jgi:O-antigen/teichoic acid export membrane protein
MTDLVKPDPPEQVPADAPPARRSIRQNTLAQLGPLVVGYGLSFITVPIVLAGLGLSDYGVWAITGATAQYAALLDLGVGYSVARHIALYEARTDRTSQGQVMTAAMLLLTGLGVVLWFVAELLAGPLADALHRTDTDAIAWVMQCGVIILTCTLLARAIGAFAVGRERMDAPNAGLMFAQIVQFAAVVLAIALAPRLTVFATANAIAAAIGLVGMVVIVRWRERGIPFGRPTRARTMELLRFGVRAQFVQLGDLIVFESDKVIVGVLVSPAAAGAYEIGSRFAMAVRHVSIMPLGALIGPMTSAIETDGTESQRERYVHLAQRVAATGYPILVLGAVTSATFLTAWLGDVPEWAITVVIVLCIANLANTATGVTTVFANAAGRPGLPAIAAVTTAVLNLVLSLALGSAFGVGGVLAATAIATVVGAVLTIVLVHRAYGLPGGAFLAAVTPPLALAAVAAIPAGAIGMIGVTGRLEGMVVLGACTAAFVAVYGVAAVRTGLLPGVGPLARLAPA